jgi:hypothetical protein
MVQLYDVISSSGNRNAAEMRRQQGYTKGKSLKRHNNQGYISK